MYIIINPYPRDHVRARRRLRARGREHVRRPHAQVVGDVVAVDELVGDGRDRDAPQHHGLLLHRLLLLLHHHHLCLWWLRLLTRGLRRGDGGRGGGGGGRWRRRGGLLPAQDPRGHWLHRGLGLRRRRCRAENGRGQGERGPQAEGLEDGAHELLGCILFLHEESDEPHFHFWIVCPTWMCYPSLFTCSRWRPAPRKRSTSPSRASVARESTSTAAAACAKGGGGVSGSAPGTWRSCSYSAGCCARMASTRDKMDPSRCLGLGLVSRVDVRGDYVCVREMVVQTMYVQSPSSASRTTWRRRTRITSPAASR